MDDYSGMDDYPMCLTPAEERMLDEWLSQLENSELCEMIHKLVGILKSREDECRSEFLTELIGPREV